MSDPMYDRKSSLNDPNLRANPEWGTGTWIIGSLLALVLIVGAAFMFTSGGDNVNTATNVDRGAVAPSTLNPTAAPPAEQSGAPASTTGSGAATNETEAAPNGSGTAQ